MIITRHKICDICRQEVGYNKRYFIIKSKAFYKNNAGSCNDNKKHNICEDCMFSFKLWLNSEKNLKGELNE